MTEDKSPPRGASSLRSCWRRAARRTSRRIPRAHHRGQLDVSRERRGDVGARDFYSTDYYTDKLLEYLESNRGDGKPFFALATYTSPHWPLQAPDAIHPSLQGPLRRGLRGDSQAPHSRQKALGVIPWDFKPHEPLPSTPRIRRGKSSRPSNASVEARRMEIYAAMVDNLDWNIGRLIELLEADRPVRRHVRLLPVGQRRRRRHGVFPTTEANDNSYDNLGRRYSNVATASAGPK